MSLLLSVCLLLTIVPTLFTAPFPRSLVPSSLFAAAAVAAPPAAEEVKEVAKVEEKKEDAAPAEAAAADAKPAEAAAEAVAEVDWDKEYLYFHEGHVQGPVPLSHLAHWVQEDHFDGELQVKPADAEGEDYVSFNTIGAGGGAAATEGGEAAAEEGGGGGEEQQWFYLHEGHEQGPVPTSHLAHWVDNGHFTLELMVKAADDPSAEFVTLGSVSPDDS